MKKDYGNRFQNQLLNKELIAMLSRLPKNIPVFIEHWTLNKENKMIKSWLEASGVQRIRDPDDTVCVDQIVITSYAGSLLNKKRPIKRDQ